MAKKVRILLALAAVYLVFCSLAVCTRAEVEEEEEAADEQSYVLTLDASNLTETVAKHDFIVVEFYAPWCGHCQQLAPEYEKAAAILAEHDPPIVLAKLDGNEEKNKAVLSEYNIGGFPSLKVFKNKGSVVTDYKGPREADGIVEHLKKLLQPPSLEIKSSDDAAKFDDEKVYVIGVFPEFSGEEFENFIQVAEKLRSDYDFGHTKDAKLLTKGDTEIKGPSARLFKPYDELHADTKDFKPESLEKFIEDLSKPLVTVLTKDPATHPMVIKYFNLDNTKALLFVNFSTENIEAYRSEFHAASKVGKEGEIIFLLGDLEASDGAFEFFGLSLDLAPLILINGKNGKKFYKGNVKADEIIPYIKDYLAGKLTPFIKSAPIPETNDEPVKVVVTHSIQDMFYSGKNVLLEFYAPWCGHCKSLAPILEEAAIALKDDPEVVIAKLDATANDVPPEFEVPGYPTLYFRSASGKIVKYESGRSKEDIIEFINKNRDPPAVSAASATIESKVSDQEDEPVKDEL